MDDFIQQSDQQSGPPLIRILKLIKNKRGLNNKLSGHKTKRKTRGKG
jgi:hypothetical protein